MKLKHILKTASVLALLTGPSAITTVESVYAEEAQDKVADSETNLEALSQQVRSSVQTIEDLNDELAQLDTTIADVESEIEQAEADISQQEAVIEDYFDQAKSRLQNLQLSNVNENAVLSFLEADSLQDLLARVNAVVQLSQANSDQMQSAQDQKDKFDQLVATLESKQNDLTDKKEAIEEKKQAVNTELIELEALIEENQGAFETLKNEDEIAEVCLRAEELVKEHQDQETANTETPDQATDQSEELDNQPEQSEENTATKEVTEQSEPEPEAEQAPQVEETPVQTEQPEQPEQAQPESDVQEPVEAQPESSEESVQPQTAGATVAQYSIDDLEFQGIIHTLGKKWTFYSERVLPGGGLNIPGRHTADGFVRDGEGYIVLAASSSVGHGTIVDTPFGSQGKVYDTCASCHADWFDVYTR